MKMRVEYIDKPYKDKVYSYPFLVSSYRDEKGRPTKKVIHKLSHLPRHAVIALKHALSSSEETEYVALDAIKYKNSLPFGDTWVVWSIMNQLGITKALERLEVKHKTPIIASIVDRVTNAKPYSKRVLSESFETSCLKRLLKPKKQIPQTEWYNALEFLYSHQMEIQKEIFKSDAKRIYLYDITSSYFEGDCCPIADWGYNRDGKKGKKIIVIGLLTNSEGRPIAVRVFPGKTNDQTTVIEQIRELGKEFGIEEMVFVGDRGMITSKRISELETGEFKWVKYITALKRKEMMQLVEDKEHPIQLGLFDHTKLVEVMHDGKRYILCHNPLRKKEDEEVRLRLLYKTEEKLKSIENCVNSGKLKKKDKIAKRLYRWLNKWNMERFFTVKYGEGFFEFSRKDDEIKRYSVIDGCYVIVSNVDEKEMDTKNVHQKYKDLKYVENSFRSMKVSDIFLRPIRHWNENRVRGHVFMCMLAYLIVWEVRKRLSPLLERDPITRKCKGGSLREIWDTLNKITIGELKIQGERLVQLSTVTKKQREIINLLKTPFKRHIIEDCSK